MKKRRKAYFSKWRGISICLAAIFLLFLQTGTAKGKADGDSGVRRKMTVTFYTAAGQEIYRQISVEKGGRILIPGMRNAAGKTMLGWSGKKGARKNPQYQVGQRISVNRSMKLYPVIFSRSKEPDLTRKEIARARSAALGKNGKFKRVVFVGDSRMTGMWAVLGEEFNSAVIKDVYFVCRYGSMLDWLQQVGAPKILQLAEEGTAVIFNHGINDLDDSKEYLQYMEGFGKKLRKRGCTLFYMSINPVNNLEIVAHGTLSREERKIIKFNERIREGLCENGAYHYLDCYSYLIKTGYGTYRKDQFDDGLHYSAKTYKRIYEFCLRSLEQYE